MSAIRRRDAGGGYILVTVLAVAVMLTGLLAAGSVLVRSAIGTARVEDADVAASGLVASGLEIAAYQLAVLKIQPDLVDGRRIRLTGGMVTPHIVDEAGKVDLNGADPKLLTGVIEGVGMDRATAATVVTRIVELRGPAKGVIPEATGAPGTPPATAGTLPTTPGTQQTAPGAQTAAQNNQQTAQPGGNAPRKHRGLQSVEDLSDIEGVRAEDMRLLRQRLTIYNPDGRLDIRTAAPDLLATVPGMTKLKLTQLLAARQSASPEALVDVQNALGELAAFTKAVPGPAYTVRVEVAEKSGRKKSVQAVIAASKSPNQPYYVLDWRE